MAQAIMNAGMQLPRKLESRKFENIFLCPWVLRVSGEEDFPTLLGIKPLMASPAANSATPHQHSFKIHKGRRAFHRHHHMSTLGIVVLIVAIA
ncbi:MAG TPA: hypothetical protein VJR04_05145, partial [Terriglobales bacterium]|nr:hypothetical protein [Terriglobales bacterium]